MKKILLSNNDYALVDDEDWLYLVGFTWSISSGKGYAQARVNGKMQLMHRIVAARAGINCPDDVDHINGNPQDNRRSNLRAATRSQNNANSKRHCNNTSGIKGVYWHKQAQKWRTQISVDYKIIHLGYYDTKEAAAFAYQEAARHHFKEFARIT